MQLSRRGWETSKILKVWFSIRTLILKSPLEPPQGPMSWKTIMEWLEWQIITQTSMRPLILISRGQKSWNLDTSIWWAWIKEFQPLTISIKGTKVKVSTKWMLENFWKASWLRKIKNHNWSPLSKRHQRLTILSLWLHLKGGCFRALKLRHRRCFLQIKIMRLWPL